MIVVIGGFILLVTKNVTKNHKAGQHDCCDRWIHIACNCLNVYTHRKLQKDKSLWYYLCCLRSKMPFCSSKNEHLQELMYGKIILSPNKKIITNAIRQDKVINEELLRKASNRFFTPNEFNHAVKNLVNRKYALYIHLNISSSGIIPSSYNYHCFCLED